ncbi:MAG: hypothetical protein COA94_06480 [Rickettsiales bacterium]|nr:MAG: hypothetical protein COA94_06480 [Rickettsiales bacterium]
MRESEMRMKKLFGILLICIFSSLVASADSISGRFFVKGKSLDFDRSFHPIKAGSYTKGKPTKCHGTIVYPELSHDDAGLFMTINRKIYDFVEIYGICNKDEQSNFSVSYDVPRSRSKNFFSVLWMTKKDDKLWRIDSLNFNFESGNLLEVDDIFNLLSNHMMGEMVKLSAGHLPKNTNWEQFLAKIASRDVQLYIKNREWHIVFNATANLDMVIDVKIPEYFLIGSRNNDRG